MQRTVYLNKYLPVAVLYFFFNSLFLPLGLLYTSLLSPFFLFWVILQRKPTRLNIYFTIALLFACFHFIHGVDTLYYIQSSVILLAIFIFCVTFQVFVAKVDNLRNLFKNLLIINAILTCIALIFLPFPGLREITWYNNAITNGVKDVERLKMFTYEASYYSTILAPLAFYYFLKAMLLRPPQRWLSVGLVLVPLLLSLSFGIILAMILAIVSVYLSDLRLLTEHKKTIINIILFGTIAALGIIILYKVSPGNVLFKRLANVFEGQDTSFRGRTTDSFYIAWQIAMQKSILFGCGPGQVKVLGAEVLNHFYKNNIYTSANTVIPNAVAETLAVFGLAGIFLRLGIEIFFFFRTRVYTNYYRLGLFILAFFVQFTGSFITNVAEYVIWILAYSPGLFPEFDKPGRTPGPMIMARKA